MNSRTLLIDCQIFQTAAWVRGMGKYSLDLLSELAASDRIKNKEVVLIFSKLIQTDESALEAVQKAFPSAKKAHLNLRPSTPTAINKDSAHNQKILDDFILKNNYQVDFLMLSVFQKPICPAFPTNAKKFLLFYDLIPLLYHHRYRPDDNYLSRLRLLFEAETIFTISQTVRNDLNIIIGIPMKRMVNIDGAPVKRRHLDTKKPKFKVPTRYILMPTGDDIRKNNTLGVKGFELFRGRDPDLMLILTSKFEPSLRVHLEKISNNLIFAGNVSEDELSWLYEHSEMLLFPSEYEGLGLPVLEALVDNKKVVCSDIPVFREMSKTAFYHFDHHDESSIAAALQSAYQGYEWDKKISEYSKLLKHYSWARTARELVKGLSKAPNRAPQHKSKKSKIAIFAPFPSGYSAIGKVVAELHASITEEFDVDYYFEAGLSGKVLRPNYLHFVSNVYFAHDFNLSKYKEYDAVVYHIGNSEYHFETIKYALYLPGFVVLHDTFLDGVYNELQKEGYISVKRNEIEKLIDTALGVKNSSCLASIANAQLGLIAHSSYAQKAAQDNLIENIPIKRSHLPVSTPFYNVQEQARKLVRIGLAGILTERKGLDIIKQIASLPQFDNCIIDIFGFNYGQQDFLKQISEHPNVMVNTNLSDFEYQSKLENLDILINYRDDYRGETSLTALEAMRYGTAVVVRNIGWFSELPDDAVVKVENPEDLIIQVTELVQNKQKRMQIGKSAQKCTAAIFSPKKYVQDLKNLINDTFKMKSNTNLKVREVLISGLDDDALSDAMNKLISRK